MTISIFFHDFYERWVTEFIECNSTSEKIHFALSNLDGEIFFTFRNAALFLYSILMQAFSDLYNIALY